MTLRLVFAFTVVAAGAARAQNDRVQWLRTNAVALSDAATDADLAPIRRALDGVDVIFLGESSHGDGGGHLARLRLVRYLHDQLGFNVIAWEAGVREAAAFDSLLGTTAPLGSITPTALYPWWAPSAELRPVLDYVRQTRRSPGPLTFAGFDIQRSGPLDSLVGYVSRTFARSGDPALFPVALRDSAEDALERLLHDAAPELLRRFAAKRETFVHAIGERETQLLSRALGNLVAHAEQLRLARDADPAKRIASYNLREQHNAENILWLLRERHRGEKLIVWLHNVHAIAARFTARFDGLSPDASDTPRDATARVVKDSIGARSYSVAIVSYDGAWGFPGGDRTALPPAPAGSLAASLHDAGFARAFLDVTGNGRPIPAWLSAPMMGTLNTQSPARYPVTWPRVVDGVLFIDHMTPSTVARD
jgi:erythromycin esterase